MTFSIDNTVYRSPNFNSRPTGAKPSSICLHTTEGAWPSDIEWLCNPQTSAKYPPVSCHYVISPDATIYQIVDDDKRAWHAGSGSYLGITDWNDCSIGVEVSHRAGNPWTPAQKQALRDLCLELIRRYAIEQSRIVAHRWIAPDRRSDPTDWPDTELVAWIQSLYAVDFVRLWGSAFAYHPEHGIAAAWRDTYRTGSGLGAAVTDEATVADGYMVRVFMHGLIRWHPVHVTEVRRWRE